MPVQKEVYIVGGPNGSGKTTFVKQFLPQYVKVKNFVNADDIAVGLSPLDRGSMNIRSGRLMLELIKVFIYFLDLTEANLAVSRVRYRVQSGGHDIPEETIRRRYLRSRHNFWYTYRKLADSWYLFNNSSKNPVVIANSVGDKKMNVFGQEYFDFFLGSIKIKD